MILNEDKFKNVVLFFLTHCNNSQLGKTKLLKLFYFLDFGYYAENEKSITNSTYVRYQYGPIPAIAESLLRQMKKDHQIMSFNATYHGKRQTRYAALAGFNPDLFTKDELNYLWAVARTYSLLNADEVMSIAHSETPWLVTEPLQFISYELAKLRDLTNLEEVRKLKKVAATLTYDDIIKNTPNLLDGVKEAIGLLPKSKFYSYDEVFN